MGSLEVTVLVGKVFLELSKMPAKVSMTLKFLEETRKKILEEATNLKDL